METMKQVLMQETNELRFNRKHIDLKIKTELLASPFMVSKLAEGEQLIKEYMAGSYYESKMKRIAQLVNIDIPSLVLDMFVGIAYILRPELFTAVTAQMASRLKLSDKKEAITATAEMIAVLCNTDAFDIFKEDKMASLHLVSRMKLSDALIKFIEESSFLPPMLCEPLELTHNYSSGYLTHNDSLILGSGNHHDGDICLDVLNIMNRVALKMDPQFLSTVEEVPSFKEGDVGFADQEKIDQWTAFKHQSYGFYSLIFQQGNHFYFNHKVDKRLRIYSQGYHMNPQGASFKKAMLEFANEELVTGVPT